MRMLSKILAGVIAPDGRWVARCPDDGQPAVVMADLDNRPESIDVAVTRARPWRRLARAGIYDTPAANIR